MDIRDYEYIVRIAEQRSISQAAASLFITQSALTKYLQRTEKQLGLKLFDRKGHNFVLTDAGERYVEIGRKIIRMDQDLTVQLDTYAAEQRKIIRFGFTMGRSAEIFHNILPAFYNHHPDVLIKVKLDSAKNLKECLINGTLDLALLSSTESLTGYHEVPLDQSWFALAVPKDSLLCEKAIADPDYPFPVIGIEDIQDCDFLVTDPHTHSGQTALDMFQYFGIHPRVILEVSDTRSLLEATEEGFGIAPMLSIPLGSRPLRYLSIRGFGQISRPVNIVYRQNKALSPAMHTLIRLFQDQTH